MKWDKTLGRDHHHFQEIVNLYYAQLCAYSVQFTDSPSDTEDIVQDVLLKFWEDKKYLLAKDSLRGYIFRSVRNASIDYIRKNKQYIFQSLEEAAYLADDKMGMADLELQHQNLHALLNQLPKQEHRALISVVVENKKYKEIADEMGISVNTLKTHLSRAMKFLRKHKISRYMILLFY